MPRRWRGAVGFHYVYRAGVGKINSPKKVFFNFFPSPPLHYNTMERRRRAERVGRGAPCARIDKPRKDMLYLQNTAVSRKDPTIFARGMPWLRWRGSVKAPARRSIGKGIFKMADEKRIYGEKISINTEKMRDFYSKRAAGATPESIGAVTLGDPRYWDEKNAYDRDQVLPMLQIGAETRVLDIGCGIGRWAGFILPNCKFYCGVDFSPEMLRVAKQVCESRGGRSALHCMSAVEAACQSVEFYGGPFEAVIIAGVLIYNNDSDVRQIFRGLPELLAEHCVIYLRDPVGRQERLTLNDYPSKSLHDSYSAIYRTAEEYMELYAPLFDVGFSVERQEFLPDMGDHSDSGRYHFILRR